MKEKDYSKYFQGPSLKDARKRKQQAINVYSNVYNIPNDMVGVGRNKKYFIRTYGCQANERDEETLAGILEMLGYTRTLDSDDADIIILNTCAVRDNAERKVFGTVGNIKALKRENPDLIFAICGCMAQEESTVRRILEKHRYVDLVFGTHNIHRLPHLIKEVMETKEAGKKDMVIEVWSKEGDIIENTPIIRASKHKAWVNIMYGCDKFCTYCIVPYTRGKERSRLPEDIIKEVNGLVADGYQEITLLGQNVNSYGKDLQQDYDFANLLEDVAKTNIPRIRFTTSHPHDFTEEMVAMIAKYDNIMPAIHLPVQSGSSSVLRRMARSYKRDEYMNLFHMIKRYIPDCTITTDIIVGFPNETDEEFEDTLSLYNECQYDLAYTFIYSKREGTPAARMEDEVDRSTKEQRLYKLNDLVEKYAHENNQKFLGQTVKVLVDGYSKRTDEMLTGYTEHQKLVNFKGDPSTIGKIVDVKITEAKTWALTGEAVKE